MSGGKPGWSEWPQELRLERLDDVPSTQDLMREELASGRDVHGLVLRANSQLRGKGRQQTSWSSAPGGSYQTLALRDDSGSLQTGVVTLAVALGVARAFAGSGSRLLIKWPNDLYLPSARDVPPRGNAPAGSPLPGSLRTGRPIRGSLLHGSLLPGKVGGILCEHVKGHLLVGVGLNVRNEAPPGAGRLAELEPQLGPEDASELVLSGIEDGLLRVLASNLPTEFSPFDLLAGRWIRVQDGEAEHEGVAAGVDAHGCLLIRNENGAASSCRARIIAIE